MKRYPGIDYSQRPQSFWDDHDTLATILRNVKGTRRRRLITSYWKQGRLQELRGEFLQATLSEQTRDQLGKIHPEFMGGEYLPDYEAEEVEIARIELRSTTSDVISLRAKRDPRGIRYRVLDEYGTEFDLAFETSRGPLSLRRLIAFIERSSHPELNDGLALCYNQLNSDDSNRETVRHFTTIVSDFYPQLYEHFEQVFEDWVNEK